MRSRAAAALLGALALAACASSEKPAPDVRIVYAPEAVAGCERKGTLNVNLTQADSDVREIRSPEMRLKAATVGGNVLLVLSSRTPDAAPVAVYACPLPKDAAPKPKG